MSAPAVPLCLWVVKPLAAERVIRWADRSLAPDMTLAVSVNRAAIATIPPRDEIAFVSLFWMRENENEELMLSAQVEKTVHALKPTDTIEIEVCTNAPDVEVPSLFNGHMRQVPSVLAAMDIAVNGITLHRSHPPDVEGTGSVMVVVREVRGDIAVAVIEGNEHVATSPLSPGDRVRISFTTSDAA